VDRPVAFTTGANVTGSLAGKVRRPERVRPLACAQDSPS